MRSKYFICKSMEMANWLITKGFPVQKMEKDFTREGRLVYKFLCSDRLFYVVKKEWDSRNNRVRWN